MPLSPCPTVRRLRLMLPLSLCLGALNACALPAGGGAEATALRGTTWVWVPLQGPLPAAPTAPPSARVAQLRLDPQALRVTGHTGCNRLMADFTLDGSTLRFGQPATTRMACLDEGNLEPAFLQALEAVRSWRVEGRVLSLLGEGSRPVMRLQAAP